MDESDGLDPKDDEDPAVMTSMKKLFRDATMGNLELVAFHLNAELVNGKDEIDFVRVPLNAPPRAVPLKLELTFEDKKTKKVLTGKASTKIDDSTLVHPKNVEVQKFPTLKADAEKGKPRILKLTAINDTLVLIESAVESGISNYNAIINQHQLVTPQDPPEGNKTGAA